MNSDLVKLVCFVPVMHADAVRLALGSAGAGKIGNYTHCTFSTIGQGRFIARDGANPTIGELNKSEIVQEERIETLCSRNKVKEVIEAVKKVHPYEEVAFDIFPLISTEDL